jgi:hypothetical protein
LFNSYKNQHENKKLNLNVNLFIQVFFFNKRKIKMEKKEGLLFKYNIYTQYREENLNTEKNINKIK